MTSRSAITRGVLLSSVLALSACTTTLSADAGTPTCQCTPPAPTCNGNTKLTPASPHCLADGGCDYQMNQTPCLNGCSNGQCLGDPCRGVICNQPPTAVCIASNTLRVYASSGVCAGGGCSYASSQVTCTCQNNACVGNPCAGVTCNSPPASACVGNSVRTYAAAGTCNGTTGQCVYTPTDTSCAAGCQNGQCVNDPCAGVTCSQPPAPTCLDSATAQTSLSPGTCNGATGSCVYGTQVTTCGAGQQCSQGACVTSPPQCNAQNCAGCCNGTTCVPLSSQSGGECGAGGAACAGCGASSPACVSGVCTNECNGVACNSPPVPTCLNSSTVQSYGSPGTCDPASGSCTYAPFQQTCPSGQACQGGICTPVCSASTCAGCCKGTTCVPLSSQTNGECGTGGGACAACGTASPVCVSGVCTNECAGVTCNQPPPPSCLDGTTVQTYASTGTCDPSTGACSYAPTQQACSSGATCQGGACVQSCSPANCTGCCSGSTCIPLGNENTSQCGSGGAQCTFCPAPLQASPVCTASGTCSFTCTGGAVKCGAQCCAATNISAGSFFTCATTYDGSGSSTGGVKCWGSNYYGQLGNGTFTDNHTPGDVSGLTSGVDWAWSGDGHVCAHTGLGGIKCWGANYSGQLGDGTTTWRATPVDAFGLTSGTYATWIGAFHSCAILSGSYGLMCWGYNSYGEVGTGVSGNNQLTPAGVVGLGANAPKVIGGGYHTCALTTNNGTPGPLECWGGNWYGQLGNGTTSTIVASPVTVSGGYKWSGALAAGDVFTCAVYEQPSGAASGVKCWGHNDHGQLGNGTTTDSSVPVDVVGLVGPAYDVAAGTDGHACAVVQSGSNWIVQCWGKNDYGQLGDGTYVDHPYAVTVGGIYNAFGSVTAGAGHTCVGDYISGFYGPGIKCWGRNDYGQLGDGTTTTQPTPVPVSGN